MSRSLPKLVKGVKVEVHGSGASMVVDLSLDGERPKRLDAGLWSAVALLDAYETVDAWKAAVRQRMPNIDDARAEKILEAVVGAGFAAVPAAPPPPREPRPPRPKPAEVQDEDWEPEVSGLVEQGDRERRGKPMLNTEITQVTQVPMRPPAVRRDLKARRTEKPGMVRVTLPEGRSTEMPEREYRILLELDGIRDIRTIHSAMSARGATFSFEQLSMFVASMVRQGLVTDSALDLPVRPTAAVAPHANLPEDSFAEPTGPIALPEESMPSAAPVTGASAPDAQPDGAPGDDGKPPGDPADGAATPDGAAGTPTEPATAGAAEGAWESADAVSASPEAKRRRAQRRLKQLARVAVLPAALLVVGLVVRYPLTITYECEIEPVQSSTVRSPIDGVLAAVAVDEGQRVEVDQVLGNLDNAAVQLELVKNRAALERATAELELLKQGSRAEEVDRARARINGLANEAGLASARLARVQALVKQGVAAREEQDRAAGERAAILGQLQQARADLKLLQAGARPDDIKRKEADINGLSAQLEVSVRQLAATVLKAPMAGVVTTQKPKDKVNTKVGVGDPIFEIVSPEQMRATVLVSERDFDVLRKGLPIKVKVSAYPVDEFVGEVVRVAEKVERGEGGNIIRAEGILDNKEGKLVPHMTGFAEIRAESRPVVSLIGRRILRWVRVRFLI